MNNAFISFLDTIVDNYNNKKYLLGVSGGMDSMAMLYLFHKSNLNFAVANVNFNLRNNESDTDSLFVRDYCKKNNIIFFYNSFDTKEYANTEGISTQMAARDLRYDWFNKLMEQESFDNIAIAHHLDDQVETFFINLIRGTGIEGMHGISSNKNFIIRPLLFTNRTKIANFIKQNEIPYREDSSNASDKYQRNYIRHHILSEFKKLRPDFSESLNESITKLQKIEDYALFQINAEIKKISKFINNRILQIDIEGLMSSYSPSLILYYCIKEYGFQESHIANIIELIEKKKIGSSIQSSEFEIFIDRNSLLLRNKKENANNNNNNDIIIESFSDKNWAKLNIDFEENFEGNYKVNNNNLAFIDADNLSFPLTLRNRKDGDFFYPLGMNSKKNISDFFIDNKISRIEKDNIPILINSDNKIIWIIGHRIDNRFSITKKTKNIIKLQYNGNY